MSLYRTGQSIEPGDVVTLIAAAQRGQQRLGRVTAIREDRVGHPLAVVEWHNPSDGTKWHHPARLSLL